MSGKADVEAGTQASTEIQTLIVRLLEQGIDAKAIAIATCGIDAPRSAAISPTTAITFAARPCMYFSMSPLRRDPQSVLSSGTSSGRYVPLNNPTPSGL